MISVIRESCSQRGFSLVEILIAIVVFTAGVIAVMYLFPLGARDIGKARELASATFYGQERLEEELMKDIDFSTLPLVEKGDFGSEDYPELGYTMTKDRYQDSSGNKLYSVVQISVKVYRGGNENGPMVNLYTLKSTGGSIETQGN